MARTPDVRVRRGQWYSEAGGNGRSFGPVETTTRAEALAKLWAALAAPEVEARSETPTLTVNDLVEKFLTWLEANRSSRTHLERKRHLERFTKSCGRCLATEVKASHLEELVEFLRKKYEPEYVRKHVVSVKAAFNHGRRKGLLPSGFSPFVGVDPIAVEPAALLESDLPTPTEVAALIDKSRGLMTDIIRLYHATGARTHELLEARVGSYQPSAGAIVLGKHKRSATARDKGPRSIPLNDLARSIVVRLAGSRAPDAHLIVNRVGEHYTRWEMARRFNTVRKAAGVRDHITIYSFRHLWITDMIRAGINMLLIARMAGTSLKMIEQVYGHFRAQDQAEALARLDRSRAG
jgi:integrase